MSDWLFSTQEIWTWSFLRVFHSTSYTDTDCRNSRKTSKMLTVVDTSLSWEDVQTEGSSPFLERNCRTFQIVFRFTLGWHNWTIQLILTSHWQMSKAQRERFSPISEVWNKEIELHSNKRLPKWTHCAKALRTNTPSLRLDLRLM